MQLFDILLTIFVVLLVPLAGLAIYAVYNDWAISIRLMLAAAVLTMLIVTTSFTRSVLQVPVENAVSSEL